MENDEYKGDLTGFRLLEITPHQGKTCSCINQWCSLHPGSKCERLAEVFIALGKNGAIDPNAKGFLMCKDCLLASVVKEPQ